MNFLPGAANTSCAHRQQRDRAIPLATRCCCTSGRASPTTRSRRRWRFPSARSAHDSTGPGAPRTSHGRSGRAAVGHGRRCRRRDPRPRTRDLPRGQPQAPVRAPDRMEPGRPGRGDRAHPRGRQRRDGGREREGRRTLAGDRRGSRRVQRRRAGARSVPPLEHAHRLGPPDGRRAGPRLGRLPFQRADHRRLHAGRSRRRVGARARLGRTRGRLRWQGVRRERGAAERPARRLLRRVGGSRIGDRAGTGIRLDRGRSGRYPDRDSSGSPGCCARGSSLHRSARRSSRHSR